MSRKKSAATEGEQVTVLLSCVYAGHPDSPGPGDIVTVDAEEAARLVDLGVAKVMDAAAHEETQPGAEA